MTAVRGPIACALQSRSSRLSPSRCIIRWHLEFCCQVIEQASDLREMRGAFCARNLLLLDIKGWQTFAVIQHCKNRSFHI